MVYGNEGVLVGINLDRRSHGRLFFPMGLHHLSSDYIDPSENRSILVSNNMGRRLLRYLDAT